MEIIQLESNQLISSNQELVQLTIGDYSGCWALQEQTITLNSGEICTADEAHYIRDDYYHESEFDEAGIVYDHYNEEYRHMDDCVFGYISYRNEGYFSIFSEYVCYNDTNYLDYDVAANHGVYYCSDCDSYYTDECNCDDEDDYCFDYHSGNRTDYSGNSIYKIGFEVEKEDSSQRERHYAWDLFDSTGWAKERDGSLAAGGYELISPVYPFNLAHSVYMQEIITSSIAAVVHYIDADYSDNCGGHINISAQGMSSQELLAAISGYLPLFYSIYQRRITNTYSKAKCLDLYVSEPNKYSAFNCKHNGVVEIRIFPAVKNVSNLLWRAELLRLILKSATGDFRVALSNITNPNNEIHQHLKRVFSTDELFGKVKLFAKYTLEIDKSIIKQKNVNRNLYRITKAA